MEFRLMLQIIIIGLILPLVFSISRMAMSRPFTGIYSDTLYSKYPISNDRAMFMGKRRTPTVIVDLKDRHFVPGNRPTYNFDISVRPGAHGINVLRSTFNKNPDSCKDPCRGVKCGIGMRCRLVNIPCFYSSCNNSSVQPSCVINVKPVQVNEVNQCYIGEPVLSFSSVINEMNCTVSNRSSCPTNYSCEPALYNGLPKCCYIQSGCMVRKIKTRTVASTVHKGGNQLCPNRKSLGECKQECVNFRDCRYNEICCRNSCGLNQCVKSSWGSVVSKQSKKPRRFSLQNVYSRNAFYYRKLKSFAQPIPIR